MLSSSSLSLGSNSSNSLSSPVPNNSSSNSSSVYILFISANDCRSEIVMNVAVFCTKEAASDQINRIKSNKNWRDKYVVTYNTGVDNCILAPRRNVEFGFKKLTLIGGEEAETVHVVYALIGRVNIIHLGAYVNKADARKYIKAATPPTPTTELKLQVVSVPLRSKSAYYLLNDFDFEL